MSRPLAAIRPIIASSASTHMSGDDTATSGALRGSTPCSVPYCGNASSNPIDDSKTTCARRRR
jgi:hypothetical protein